MGDGDNTPGRKMVVVGGSAGALGALQPILTPLPSDYSLPIVLVLHRLESSGAGLVSVLQSYTALTVIEIEDKAPLIDGYIHLAPAGYHLLLEAHGSFGLSIDARVNYSRPSIDVLFDSVAKGFGSSVTGVLLSGANSDGASGLKRVSEAGGLTIAQDPSSAVVPFMPQAAIAAEAAQKVMAPACIGELLAQLDRQAQ